MSVIERLTNKDFEMIDDYRRSYAYNEDNYITNNAWCDVNHLLRFWDKNKSSYLEKLFDDKLMITKKISFEKSIDQLSTDMMKMFDKYSSMGRVGRNGNEFYRAFNDLVYSDYQSEYHWEYNYRFSYDVRDNLIDLITESTLVKNIYEGDDFEMPTNVEGKTLKIKRGTKVIKILGKIAEAFNLPGFEDFRLCHSQILNQKELHGNMTLSIHPLDYMTMSDNESGWESCMSWQNEGCYRMGTVEMMNSPTVIVAYLSSDEDMGMPNGNAWNNKKWRQLFVVDRNIIIAVKDYPYHNQELSRACLDWIRDLAKEKLEWTYLDPQKWDIDDQPEVSVRYLPDISGIRFNFDTGSMYSDFGATDYHWCCINDNIDLDNDCSLHLNSYSHTKYYSVHIEYSGLSECMACGTANPYIDNDSYLIGECCQTVEHCDECGDRIYSEDDIYEVDGMRLCRHCYDYHVRECAVCAEEHLKKDMVRIECIPRLTPDEMRECADRDFWNSYTDIDFNNPDNELIALGSDDYMDYICLHHLEEWIAENMIEGKRPHRRKHKGIYNNIYSNRYYVYYDELKPDCWKVKHTSYFKNEQTFKKYCMEYEAFRLSKFKEYI